MNLKTHSRIYLTLFGLLDALLIGQYFGRVVSVNLLPSGLPIGAPLLEFLKGIFLISLIFSAFGLCFEKHWALILGYAQFPFRLIIPMLSFGFIAQIPFLSSVGNYVLLITAIVLEVLRLIVCIQLQRGGGGGGGSRSKR